MELHLQLELNLALSASQIEADRIEREEIELVRKAQEQERLDEIRRQALEAQQIVESERSLRTQSERLAKELEKQAVCSFKAFNLYNFNIFL
jgi:hypothetical protein